MRTTAARRSCGAHPSPLRLILTASIFLFVLAAVIASPVCSQQDPNKAIEQCTALLAQNPANALSIKVDLGLAYKARKDYSHAMPLSNEVAASQDARKVQAMFFIDDCYCEQGKIADAVAVLTKAYTECPEVRADILLRRAGRECDIQRYSEALADYEEFLAKYPEKQDIISTFSARLPEIRLRAEGLFDGPANALATEWAKARSAKADPAYIKLVGFRLADCCLRDQLWSKGAEVHTRLIRDYPADEPGLKMGLAICQKGQKQYDAAIQTFTDIAANDKSHALQALFFVEDCLSEQVKYDDCVAHLTKMLADYPEAKADILMRRAARLGSAGKCEECLAGLLEVQKDCPDKLAEARLGEGLARVAIWEQGGDQSQLEKGIAILEGYSSAFPKETAFVAASQFGLGMYHLYPMRKDGNTALASNLEKGRAIMQDAIKTLPETFYTWWMRTECAASYSKEGRQADCVTELSKLLTQNPPDSWKEYILYLLGETQIGIGKAAEGKATLSQLVAQFPKGEWGELGARRLAALGVGGK